MGLIKEEVCFPRGRSSSSKPALRKPKDNLFKKYSKTPKKKPKRKFFSNFCEELDDTKKKSKKEILLPDTECHIKPLTYQTLEEGMVVLGRVRQIFRYCMFVCLPGRLSAKVSITSISEPFCESLALLRLLEVTQKECPPLYKLYREGQPVVCCVQEVKKEGDLLAVSVTLDPTYVNKNRSHYSVCVGHVMVAAVKSKEDHGYMLHTGISGLTTFLKFSNAKRFVEIVNGGRELVIGEVVRCLVLKCVTGKSSSRVEVTIDPRALSRAVLSEVNSQTLQPAATVHCTVDKIMPTGLVVNIGRTKALVETSQLGECWSKPSDYEPGTELTASVLYILPQTDFQTQTKPTYLSLKDVNEYITPQLNIGEVVDAIVCSSSYRGLVLCLGARRDNNLRNKGFVSVRRLCERLSKEEVPLKYPKGSLVTTKILGYDYMDQVYNCTLQREKMEEQFVNVQQLKAGDRVTCTVLEVDDNVVQLSLGPMRLYAYKDHSADVPHEHLRDAFAIGDIVDARVLKSTSNSAVVTLKETLIRSPMLASYEESCLGECYWGTVSCVGGKNLYIHFYNDVTATLPVKEESQKDHYPGQLVKCYVKYVNVAESKMLLSWEPLHDKEPHQLPVGEQCLLVVTRVTDDHLEVSACDYCDIVGVIPKSHLQDREARQEGDFLKAWFYLKKAGNHYFSPNPAILDFFKADGKIEPDCNLTCIARVTLKKKKRKISVYTPLAEFPQVEVDDTNWSDEKPIEDHQIVRLKVEQFDKKNKTLILGCPEPETLSSNLDKRLMFPLLKTTLPSVEQQSKLEASKLCGKDGKVVNSENTTVLKAKRKNTKSKRDEPTEKFEPEMDPSEKNLSGVKDNSIKIDTEGTKVKGKKNKSKSSEINQTVELDLETAGDFKRTQSQKNASENITEEQKLTSNAINKKTNKNNKEKQSIESQNVPSKSTKKRLSLESDVCESNAKKQKKGSGSGLKDSNHKAKPTLSETGFSWDIKPEDLNKPDVLNIVEDDDEDVEDSTGVTKKKKSAAEKRRAAKEEEARLREVEQTLLQSESNPQSADQFDRAVLARPDDAELWIKYMSHHLQATEIEKARAVARRALQTINQRHEVDRLNVWIALLNLEHLFGTQESLKSSFEEALRANDEFTVFCKMLQIYAQAKKSQETEQLVGTMLRKFRDSTACWVQCLSALMSCGLPDKARSTLQRAITGLPTREHVNLLCKFAVLESQHGFGEQAQTLFEHILTSYPKRTDVWNVYVDMLVKSNKVQVARDILERATRQRLPARKMKMLFSKWVSFEEKHGTPDKVEHVRKRALEYVNMITKSID